MNKAVAYLFVVFSFTINQNLCSQTKINYLDEVFIYSKYKPHEIIKRVLQKIETNYLKSNQNDVYIDQLSLVNNDTIVAFNGNLNVDIKYLIADFLLYHTYGSYCSSTVRKINKPIYTDWFCSVMGMPLKNQIAGAPKNHLPFFITGVVNLISIKNKDFIKNYNDYDFEINTVDKNVLYMSFSPKENGKHLGITHPYQGSLVINTTDLAVLEMNFRNINEFKVEAIGGYDVIDLLDVNIKYDKNEQNKYKINSLNSISTFKYVSTDKKNKYNNASFSSKTSLIFNTKPNLNCEGLEINLTDLGLIFKSKNRNILKKDYNELK